ncbi:MAG TPA: hypothetical protein VEC15_04215 [Actinomycetota bacterium]|nr:hypothetical protein [Actinomycetota bacterium]
MRAGTEREHVSLGARIDPVWRHAPSVLLRYRGLFVAVAVGGALLALAAAAYPLFLSATTSSLVRAAIERESITPFGAGLTYRFTNLPFEPTILAPGRVSGEPEEMDRAFARLAAGNDILGEPVRTILTPTVEVSTGDSAEDRDARLFAGTEVLEHVEILRGDGEGVWMPDLIADALGLHVGDTATLTDQRGPSAEVTVGGIYRAVYTVYTAPSDGYWLPWYDEFAIECPDCAPPPQPILASRAEVLRLSDELRHRDATFSWNAPVENADAVSLEQIQELDRYALDALERARDRSTPIGQALDCCENWFFLGRRTSLASSAGLVVTDARERIATVEGPTRVLEIAGLAVAVAVVAAAGAFSVRARRVEAAWLFARGSSAAVVGLKTALESALPVATGTVAGAVVAWVAMRAVGPDAPVSRPALLDAGFAAAAAALGAVVLLSIVAAIAYVRVVDPHGRRFARLARTVPWELALAAAAYVTLQRLREGGAFVVDADTGVRSPSLALVAFPFLFLGAFSTLAARLAAFAWGALRRAADRAGPAAYLATRRLAGGGALAILLVGAAGLCLGTFLHAQIVSNSLSTTVDAKAGIFVGSDVQGRIDYRTPIPESFELPTTRVVRLPAGVRLPEGRGLDLLTIDASSFGAAAYWNDAFADEPLGALLERLARPTDGRVPVIVAGADDLTVERLAIAVGEMRVDVIARTSAFPGMSSLNPLVIADGETLLETVDIPFDPLNNPTASTELWVRGGTDAALAALARLEFPPSSTITTAEVKDIPYISAAVDTFLVVNVLGLAAAALVFVGMLLYLNARQRSQIVAQALSSRMGMTQREQRRALVMELAAMLLWGFAVGAVLAVVAARFTVPLLDPIPTVPPDPILVLPLLVAAVAAVAIGTLAWLGATATERRSRRVDLGEVMRVAE